MLNLSLQQHYFNAMKAGLKTVEARINSLKFKDLHSGDQISFTCNVTHEVILCRVQEIIVYVSFFEMIQEQGLQNMLPDVATIAQGVAIYESFPGYKEKVKNNGVLAIKIKICEK